MDIGSKHLNWARQNGPRVAEWWAKALNHGFGSARSRWRSIDKLAVEYLTKPVPEVAALEALDRSLAGLDWVLHRAGGAKGLAFIDFDPRHRSPEAWRWGGVDAVSWIYGTGELVPVPWRDLLDGWARRAMHWANIVWKFPDTVLVLEPLLEPVPCYPGFGTTRQTDAVAMRLWEVRHSVVGMRWAWGLRPGHTAHPLRWTNQALPLPLWWGRPFVVRPEEIGAGPWSPDDPELPRIPLLSCTGHTRADLLAEMGRAYMTLALGLDGRATRHALQTLDRDWWTHPVSVDPVLAERIGVLAGVDSEFLVRLIGGCPKPESTELETF